MADYYVKLPVTGITGGIPGQILYANSSGNPVFQNYVDLANYAFYSDDFLTPPADLSQANNGTGSACKVSHLAQSAGHPGGMILSTGSTNTGYSNLFGSNVDDIISLGGGLTTFESVLNITALSNSTDRYTLQIGLTSPAYNNTLVITDGIYLTYSDNVSGGNWVFNCAASGTVTSVNTGVPVTTGWQRLGWVLNSGGTSAQAYLNGAAIGAPIAAHIPTKATNLQWYIQKAAGTTNVDMYLDAYSLFIALATPR